METKGTQDACPVCGSVSAEIRNQGLFCTACGPVTEDATAEIHHEHFPHMGEKGAPEPAAQTHERAVHHEGFPHVVSDENEP